MNTPQVIAIVIIFQPLVIMVTYYVGHTVGWLQGYRRCRKTTEEALHEVFRS